MNHVEKKIHFFMRLISKKYVLSNLITHSNTCRPDGVLKCNTNMLPLAELWVFFVLYRYVDMYRYDLRVIYFLIIINELIAKIEKSNQR